jgi:multicomponent Na+:H+ antiporter subunit B
MKTFKKKPVIVRSAADFFLPLACVYGAYVVLHGHLSPGGGFQGGVLIASATLTTKGFRTAVNNAYAALAMIQ